MRGHGTQKGGAIRRPGVALKISDGSDARGTTKNVTVIPGFGRRHRNSKHGPAGTNPKGIEAQRKAAGRRD